MKMRELRRTLKVIMMRMGKYAKRGMMKGEIRTKSWREMRARAPQRILERKPPSLDLKTRKLIRTEKLKSNIVCLINSINADTLFGRTTKGEDVHSSSGVD
jgi:hypothetical protein